MESLRFVHAADLHIDSPFHGMDQVNSAVAQRLRESTYEAYQNLIRLCLDEEVDFLVIAGDVYDGADRSIKAQFRFRDGLLKLAENGIQTFVVHGNHDPLDGWLVSLDWPQGVTIFNENVQWHQAERTGIPIAQIAGVSYPTRDVTENLSARFTSPPNPRLFSIGLLHCNLGGDPRHPNYAPCTVEDLKKPGIDYWALGHVHTLKVHEDPVVTIAYPGNSQGRHPNEGGARGCLLVDVTADGKIKHQFTPLDVVRWEQVKISIENIGQKDLPGLIGRAKERLRSVSDAADGRDVVCRIELHGNGPLHDDIKRPNFVEELEVELNSMVELTPPWCWVDRITDRTRPEIDLEQAENQDDFLAHCLKAASGLEPGEIEGLLDDVYSGSTKRLPIPSEADLSFDDLIGDVRWYLAELLRRES